MKDGTYPGEEFGDNPAPEADLDYLVKHKLLNGRLVGFIAEGITPYGNFPMSYDRDPPTGYFQRGARRARRPGNPEGFLDLDPSLFRA